MKVICPISGVPFRTYDSLSISIPYEHPIFSIPFESLILLLEDIREQEEQELHRLNPNTVKDREEAESLAVTNLRTLTNESVTAIHERNWRNPTFKLYQTKHITMLAFMRSAGLLENENGYAARPNPNIIDAYFWEGVGLFSWCSSISNPQIIELLPHYRISKNNEDMGNLNEYLSLLSSIKDDIGSRYRSIFEERKIDSLQKAITILNRRRDNLKTSLLTSGNHLAAKWALMVTRAPKSIYDFWYAILASSSIKITFEGVRINDKWEAVSLSDLHELRDYLEDNLYAPRGETKKEHRDDSEYYFMARQVVLAIVNRHIAIIEQGTSSYRIVNTAMSDNILSSSDDTLEKQALELGLVGKPNFAEFMTKPKIEFIKAMAKWRQGTKQAILEFHDKLEEGTQDKDAGYEIL